MPVSGDVVGMHMTVDPRDHIRVVREQGHQFRAEMTNTSAVTGEDGVVHRLRVMMAEKDEHGVAGLVMLPHT